MTEEQKQSLLDVARLIAVNIKSEGEANVFYVDLLKAIEYAQELNADSADVIDMMNNFEDQVREIIGDEENHTQKDLHMFSELLSIPIPKN